MTLSGPPDYPADLRGLMPRLCTRTRCRKCKGVTRVEYVAEDGRTWPTCIACAMAAAATLSLGRERVDNDSRLKDAVSAIADAHPYVKRFDRFCRQRTYKGGTRRFLVRIIRQLDGKPSILRRELIDNLMHESKKAQAYVITYLKELHGAGLITISKGNEHSSRVQISG